MSSRPSRCKTSWMIRIGVARRTQRFTPRLCRDGCRGSLRTRSSAGRAMLSVYSTNGFRVAVGQDNKRQLQEIECAPAGTTVAVDASALLTLHRLGLLSQAASYFGRLLFPSGYLSEALEESGRLV